jgi:hypothetical protein
MWRASMPDGCWQPSGRLEFRCSAPSRTWRTLSVRTAVSGSRSSIAAACRDQLMTGVTVRCPGSPRFPSIPCSPRRPIRAGRSSSRTQMAPKLGHLSLSPRQSPSDSICHCHQQANRNCPSILRELRSSLSQSPGPGAGRRVLFGRGVVAVGVRTLPSYCSRFASHSCRGGPPRFHSPM